MFSEESEEALHAAEAALSAGRLVVFPTDTVYGLAADPEVEGATGALFAAKRRSRQLTLPVLVADVAQARTVAAFDDRAEKLADAFWPGPLTIALRRTELSRPWDLGEERATVGVRVPDHPAALSLLRRTGPLAVTSANLSGEETPPDCHGVRAVLGDHVSAYLCWGPAPRGVASTVLNLCEHRARVIREGEIPAAELLALVPDAT